MTTAEMMFVYLDEEVPHLWEVSYALEWEEGEDDWRKPWLTWVESEERKEVFVGSRADLRDFIESLKKRPAKGWVASVKAADLGRV